MSFKLYLASALGLIKPTVKIEAAHDALLADYQLFNEFHKSKELKEYHELELLVSSPTFKQKKKELQSLTLKGSKEAAQLDEYKKLERNSRLQRLYDTLKTEDLKRYEKMSGSGDLEAFDQFRKSPAFKNYVAMKDSPERRRFEELQKVISSEEFKSRVAYLEDKQKWEKTEDAQKEIRIAEMQKSPQLINYLKYKHSTAFDFFKKWELVFEDRFDSGKLDTEKWMTQSYWASQALGQNFSQVGDLHAFTDGKNVSLNGHALKLEVRREKATSMQWRIPFGFVEQEFDYTSGIVSTAGGQWWKHGILEAKVKYDPAQNLVDAIYLLGDETSPQVNLVEMGEKNRVGLFTRKADGFHAESESLTGLKTGEYYIFRLEWTAHSLVWKINNRVVLTITHNVPDFKMHLNAATIVLADPAGSLPHRFEIAWVRFYQHHHEKLETTDHHRHPDQHRSAHV
ncbi:MAG TPA: hypothetical protein DCL77_08040 [Prolixibacteraceae bacterium]|jgi:beta-glucanase (GH16 family)|nr:hypothetical protein [Prolixibacteraceae bacterium]